VKDCLFCRIARREAPAEIILETEEVLVFRDINPVAPTHLLVIPKRHVGNILDPHLSKEEKLAGELFRAVQMAAAKTGLTPGGFRTVINCGPDAGEAIPHLHLHLIGGKKLSWPPG
jgi:histidine triad (HIT) family protein